MDTKSKIQKLNKELAYELYNKLILIKGRYIQYKEIAEISEYRLFLKQFKSVNKGLLDTLKSEEEGKSIYLYGVKVNLGIPPIIYTPIAANLCITDSDTQDDGIYSQSIKIDNVINYLVKELEKEFKI